MKINNVLLLLALPISTVSHANENNKYSCATDDASYNFGLEIQRVFRERDTESLSEMFKRGAGPRKEYLLANGIDKVFTKETIDNIITSDIPCDYDPNSRYGYTFDKGGVWYTDYDGYGIVDDNYLSINYINYIEEELDKSTDFISSNGKIISPSCLSARIEYLGDEGWSNFYNLKGNRFDVVYDEIGQMLNREIKEFKPFKGPYYRGDGEDNLDQVALELKHCSDNPTVEDGTVYGNKDSYNRSYQYEVIQDVSTELCNSMATGMEGTCKQAKLVKSYVDNSFNGTTEYNIYGLFDFKGMEIVSPLKIFFNENEAIDYLKEKYVDL